MVTKLLQLINRCLACSYGRFTQWQWKNQVTKWQFKSGHNVHWCITWNFQWHTCILQAKAASLCTVAGFIWHLRTFQTLLHFAAVKGVPFFCSLEPFAAACSPFYFWNSLSASYQFQAQDYQTGSWKTCSFLSSSMSQHACLNTTVVTRYFSPFVAL